MNSLLVAPSENVKFMLGRKSSRAVSLCGKEVLEKLGQTETFILIPLDDDNVHPLSKWWMTRIWRYLSAWHTFKAFSIWSFVVVSSSHHVSEFFRSEVKIWRQLLILIYGIELREHSGQCAVNSLMMSINLDFSISSIGDIEPPPQQKKKGFFKSFWKKSRHYSLEQN